VADQTGQQLLRFGLKRHEPQSTLAVHLSDLHFKPETFSDDVEQRALRHVEAAITTSLAGRQPDLILVTGDLIHSEKWDDTLHLDTLKKSRDYLIGLCAKFGVNPDGLVVIGGNHDFKYRGVFAAKGWLWFSKQELDFYERMHDNFEAVFPRFDHHRLYGEDMRLLVGCFDSNERRGPFEFATGVADIEQVNALADSIGKLKPEELPRRRIALIHHHPLPVPAAEILDPQHWAERTAGRVFEGAPEMMLLRNAGVFLERLLDLDFSMVLHGHLHCHHYWGPVYGVKHRDRWLEVISGASFCTMDGRRSFGLLELLDDGTASYVTHWATAEGRQGRHDPLLCVPYERSRQRTVEQLLAVSKPMFKCRRIHKMWEVILPAGDVRTTEVFEGLQPVAGNKSDVLEIESWASALTRQTFEAEVVGPGPKVAVEREQVKKPNDANDWIKYTLRFNRELGHQEQITLVSQRETIGAAFSSVDAQRFWGFPRSELGHDICTHVVSLPCDELLMTLRFTGPGPGGVELLVTDQDGNSIEAEERHCRRWAAFSDGLDVRRRDRVFTSPQLTLAIDTPLPRHRYRLKWHVLAREDVPNLQALTHIRKQLLRLRDNPDRDEAKLAREFLEHCVERIRAAIRERARLANADDRKLIACLFTVDTSTMSDDEYLPCGATMKCVVSTIPESALACSDLPWGRDIVGRAARRGVVASYNRSQLQYAVEVTHKLPPNVEFLLAFPLYCYDPDGYPSAVVALSTSDSNSGLGTLVPLVETEDAAAMLLAPLQAVWLENFARILNVPAVLDARQ
jgi:predicted MPP superfamily phosphohydrolase